MKCIRDDINIDGNSGGGRYDGNEIIRIKKKRWHKISVIINNCRDRYTYISRIQVHKVHYTHVQSFAAVAAAATAAKMNQNTPHPNTINQRINNKKIAFFFSIVKIYYALFEFIDLILMGIFQLRVNCVVSEALKAEQLFPDGLRNISS